MMVLAAVAIAGEFRLQLAAILRDRSTATASGGTATRTGDAPDAHRNGLRVETIAQGLEHPWSVALLPDGSFLVTERPGRLRRVAADGTLGEPIASVPAVFAQGQGGLLDVVLAPDFATSKTHLPQLRRTRRRTAPPAPPSPPPRSATTRCTTCA